MHLYFLYSLWLCVCVYFHFHSYCMAKDEDYAPVSRSYCTNMNIVSDCFALHWELKVRNIKKIHIPRIDEAVFTNLLCFCSQISKTWNVRERL